MKFIAENVHMLFVVSVIFNILSGLIIALKLYSDAPEKNDIGFNKYWNALMVDASPGKDKPLLVYNDKSSRFELFNILKIISLTCLIVAIISFALIFISKQPI